MPRKKTAVIVSLVGIVLAAVALILLMRGWSGKTTGHTEVAAGIQFYQSTYSKHGQESVEIYAVVIDPDQARFSIVSQPDAGKGSALDFVALAKHHDALVLINGGYFDHHFQPVGLSIQGGNEVTGILAKTPLSAAIVTAENGSIEIIPTAHYVPNADQFDAIQAGPYVIDPGGTPGIYSEDFKRAKRSAIGLTNDGQIVLLTTSPCTLFQFSEILYAAPNAIGVGAFECVLNLDGGPSSGLYIQTQPSLTQPSKDVVPNAIAVWAK